jgi:hypothetical protein
VVRFNSAILVILTSTAVAFGECEPNWKAGNGPPSIGLNNPSYALTTYNGDLIIGGTFNKAGGVDVNRIVRWDGNSWQSLGGGVNGQVYALTVYNGELIAGGNFSAAGGVAASRIARWDGNS